jgi:hypothetical protein
MTKLMRAAACLTLFLLIHSPNLLWAQEIDGQWRGYFDSKGDIVLYGANSTEYILELEIKGNSVTGISYSYFQGRKYYVICNLQGVYNKSNKSIKVTELRRIKGNTPPDFSDCFQTHYLTYVNEKNTEKLVGYWETAPGQRNGCGSGKTALTRRTLSNDLSSFNKNKPDKTPAAVKPAPKPANPSDQAKKTEDKGDRGAKTDKQGSNSNSGSSTSQGGTDAKNNPSGTGSNNGQKQGKASDKNVIKKTDNQDDISKYEKRNTDVIETIEIQHETFTVDLYDNGEIDGDIVSVFYNDQVLVSRQKLSTQPISLKLEISDSRKINELTMYAENLGDIPPNTALMVVTDGNKRYEARIASDLKKSGTIRFVHQSKK